MNGALSATPATSPIGVDSVGDRFGRGGGEGMIRFPLVTRLATPVITNDIARVAMSELMRKNVAITPLTAPTPTPTSTPKHPETMATMRRSLADSYLARGLSKEAVAPAYRRVVADRERALGPDHVDTTRARYSLGAAYLRTGKAVAAERAYEQAQAGFEWCSAPGTRIRCAIARSLRWSTASSGGTATPARGGGG